MTDSNGQLTVIDIIIHAILQPLRKYWHPNFTLENKANQKFPSMQCRSAIKTTHFTTPLVTSAQGKQ